MSIYITLSMDGSSNKARKARFFTPFNVFSLPRDLSRHLAHGASTRVQHCGRGHADPDVEPAPRPSTIRRLVEEGLPVAPLLQVLGRVNKHQDRRLVGVDLSTVVHATQLRLRRVPSIIRQVGRRGRRDRRYTLTVGGGPVRFCRGDCTLSAVAPDFLRDADGGRGSRSWHR